MGERKGRDPLSDYDTHIYVCKNPCIRMERAQNPTLSPSSLEPASQESDDVDVDNRRPSCMKAAKIPALSGSGAIERLSLRLVADGT